MKLSLQLTLLVCALLFLLFSSHADAFVPRLDSSCLLLCGNATVNPVAKKTLQNKLLPPLKSFYRSEQLSGFGWGSVGLVSASVGVGFLFAESQVLQGMAYPMMIIGGIQLIYGIFLLAASNGRISHFSKQINTEPVAYLERETKRIHRNVFLFSLIEWFELLVAATGVGLVAGGMVAGMPIVAGVGFGLLLKGVTMYLLDLQAHVRYKRYHKTLSAILPSLQLSPSAYHPIHGRTLRIGLAWNGTF